MPSPRAFLLIALLVVSAAARGLESMVIEVIPVGYRNAEEIIAVLRPLVPPPGSISSYNNQLIVKTTPANLREIRRLLETLDRAPANLLISVSQVLNEEIRRDLAQIFAEVEGGDVSVSAGSPSDAERGLAASGGDGDSGATARLRQQRATARSRADQQVRVLEGNTAYIAVGQVVPLEQRRAVVQGGRVIVQESVQYEPVTSGFYVRPRLSGERVTLEIIPSDRRTGGAGIETREVQTTVSGRLGRWMAIGGAATTSTERRGDIGSRAETRSASDYTVYVKVTRVPE